MDDWSAASDAGARAMWGEIVMVALRDLRGALTRPAHRWTANEREARAYLTATDGPLAANLDEAAAHVGVDADAIRQHVARLLTGSPTRNLVLRYQQAATVPHAGPKRIVLSDLRPWNAFPFRGTPAPAPAPSRGPKITRAEEAAAVAELAKGRSAPAVAADLGLTTKQVAKVRERGIARGELVSAMARKRERLARLAEALAGGLTITEAAALVGCTEKIAEHGSADLRRRGVVARAKYGPRANGGGSSPAVATTTTDVNRTVHVSQKDMDPCAFVGRITPGKELPQ